MPTILPATLDPHQQEAYLGNYVEMFILMHVLLGSFFFKSLFFFMFKTISMMNFLKQTEQQINSNHSPPISRYTNF